MRHDVRFLLRMVATLAGTLVLAGPQRAAAHDIPVDVVVQMFVKPEAGRLHVVVRAPLRAMRDVEFPVRGPGYLDLDKADAALRDAAMLWIGNGIEILEGSAALPAPRIIAARASLPSDRSFESYERAFARATSGRAGGEVALIWDQAILDAVFEYPIRSPHSAFSIRPSLARLGLRVTTVLRFLPPGGNIRAFEYSGNPGLVRLDPRWHQAAGRFTALGFRHILEGTDHLLFLLCLVIPFRSFRALFVIVTSFTAAHSIALFAAAGDFIPATLWFAPLIETLIAASIVYMALENIACRASVKRRWIAAFAFGLVHGFGFSFALRESLQFAGGHLVTALVSFNLGVEAGQVLVLAILVPALGALFRFVVAERVGTIILSAVVAHTAWHWMVERGERVSQFGWPARDLPLIITVARWLLGFAIVAAAGWLVVSLMGRRTPNAQSEPPSAL